MHNSYFFVKQLVPALQKTLAHALLISSYSQNKNELILEFDEPDSSQFYIKAYLNPDFSCISFPKKMHRAKRNSAGLFNEITGQPIESIRSFKNERAFVIHFANQHHLVFKLFGNQSNVVLFHHKKVVSIFKTNLKKDLTLELDALNRDIDYSYAALKKNNFNIRQTTPTLDKLSAQKLYKSLTETPQHQGEKVYQSFFEKLTDSNMYIHQAEPNYKLSLIQLAKEDLVYTNPIEAVTVFFEKEIKNRALHQLKNKLLAQLNNRLIKTQNYIYKLNIRLSELQTSKNNQLKGDLLMAHLTTLPKGAKQVELPDFTTNEPVSMKLNPQLTIQKNAERFYRKAKNENKEVAVLKRNIKDKKALLVKLDEQIKEVTQAQNPKYLQKHFPESKKVEQDEPTPYKLFIINDFKIMVGKNAQHNDTLTLKIAKKNDLWLHAKDVSGSHVVLKQIPGRSFPKYVITQAAQLAAFYSKRKTDSLCPVIVTPKKYVRKKKAAPAGAVVVEREEVVLVEPKSFTEHEA